MSTAREQVVEVRGIGVGRAADEMVRIATGQGYLVAASGPNRFRLARTFRPMWANVCALVFSPLFGIGLFFLLVKQSEAFEGIVIEDRSGVRVHLTGSIDPALFLALHNTLADPNSATLAVPVPTAFSAQQPIGDRTPAAASSFATFASPAPPAPTAPTAPTGFGHPSDLITPSADDRTMTVAQLAAMRTTAAPALRFPDGRVVAIGAGVVVGRSPEADRNLPSAAILPFDDPSLSKTHASFGPNAHGIWVCDHHSTNGTMVRLDGSSTACRPESRVDVPIGGVVVIGEVSVSVVASGS